MFANALTQRMAAFVRGIGIDVRAERLPAETFLPGLDIRHGVIVVDEARLSDPGDLLHEAGHVAVADPAERGKASLDPTSAEELATLAWSYAALRHLDLAPEIVFHPHGYKGGAQALIDCFTKAADRGVVLGVPLLAYYGMTVEAKLAAARGVEPYPHMLRWLR
jgi:hypothetical protein